MVIKQFDDLLVKVSVLCFSALLTFSRVAALHGFLCSCFTASLTFMPSYTTELHRKSLYWHLCPQILLGAAIVDFVIAMSEGESIQR